MRTGGRRRLPPRGFKVPLSGDGLEQGAACQAAACSVRRALPLRRFTSAKGSLQSPKRRPAPAGDTPPPHLLRVFTVSGNDPLGTSSNGDNSKTCCPAGGVSGLGGRDELLFNFGFAKLKRPVVIKFVFRQRILPTRRPSAGPGAGRKSRLAPPTDALPCGSQLNESLVLRVARRIGQLRGRESAEAVCGRRGPRIAQSPAPREPPSTTASRREFRRPGQLATTAYPAVRQAWPRFQPKSVLMRITCKRSAWTTARRGFIRLRFAVAAALEIARRVSLGRILPICGASD